MTSAGLGDLRRRIRDQSVEYFRTRYQGTGNAGAWDGDFSSLTAEDQAPDLFGAVDAVYSLAILDLLEGVSTRSSREAWASRIQSFQGEDGWFRADDLQNHGRVHSTAYALGALALLGRSDNQDFLGEIGAFGADADVFLAKATGSWVELPTIQRVHFWRGSHEIGGIAAIVGQLHDYGHAAKILRSVPADDWFSQWTNAALHAVDRPTGMWLLGPVWARAAFDVVYRIRHRPEYGHMGGAAHIYWILEKRRETFPAPEALARWVLDNTSHSLICETEPYCLDFDRQFLLARACLQTAQGPWHEEAERLLRAARNQVLLFLADREAGAWNDNSHKLPGALASVAEVDRFLRLRERDEGPDEQWRDVFETVWWL